jgi:hypothetical protein
VTNTNSAISPKRTLATLLIGSTVALTVLSFSFVPEETNFEASATLGTESTPIFGSANGFPIHCSGSSDAEGCLAGQKSRGATQAALWLGNSQVHEVNQWQSGETNASPLLFDSLGRHGLDLLTFSLGNASLQEHYVMFEHLRQRMPLKVLILPVVFDDTREEGLRSDVADFAKDPATAKALSETTIGKRLVAAVQSGVKAELVSTADDTGGMTGTLQERAEKSLNGWLGEHSRLWQLRPEIRGWLFIGLYRVRNFVFGITPGSTRKVIPGRYRDNLAALQAILDRSRSEHIRVVMYIVPLRGGVKIPYDPAEYAAFRSEMGTLARQYDASFQNLEQLVPDDFWGTKASTSLGEEHELDFMHFRYSGHSLLAQALHELAVQALAKRQAGSPP